MNSDVAITQLLRQVGDGDNSAMEQLWAVFHRELHGPAEALLAGEPVGRTLQPTALIHEAYIRIFNGQPPEFQSRAHFYRLAARVMRRALVDAARKRKSEKRGGKAVREDALDQLSAAYKDPSEIIAVHEALDRLAELDACKAQLVELRYFGGFSIDECAELLGMSPRKVNNDWRFARAWLHGQLSLDMKTGVDEAVY